MSQAKCTQTNRGTKLQRKSQATRRTIYYGKPSYWLARSLQRSTASCVCCSIFGLWTIGGSRLASRLRLIVASKAAGFMIFAKRSRTQSNGYRSRDDNEGAGSGPRPLIQEKPQMLDE